MAKYKVTFTHKQTYELYVEAEDFNSAVKIGTHTKVDDYDMATQVVKEYDCSIVEPITEEDNI